MAPTPIIPCVPRNFPFPQLTATSTSRILPMGTLPSRTGPGVEAEAILKDTYKLSGPLDDKDKIQQIVMDSLILEKDNAVIVKKEYVRPGFHLPVLCTHIWWGWRSIVHMP